MKRSLHLIIFTTYILFVYSLLIQIDSAIANPKGGALAPTTKVSEVPAAEESEPAEPLRPVNTKGIDEAGEKVGKGIENIKERITVE